MRVRGYWPLRENRAIPLPIRWADWLTTDDGDGDIGDGGGRGRHGGQVSRGRGGNNKTSGRGSSASGKVFVPINPFTDPASLKALKKSTQLESSGYGGYNLGR